MDRRAFLQRAVVAGTGAAVLPSWALVAPAGAQGDGRARPGTGPYGPLRDEPDENGLLLPEGFTSRVIGVAGEPVGDTDQLWHAFPDGSATFPTEDGGWIYTCNSEVFPWHAPDSGGVTAVRFDADGEIADAYRILDASNSNCAGGPTPWGTWLSCEENEGSGRVFECDPTGATEAVARPAMGIFAHEAVAVDEASETLYLTQDQPEGLLYRFTPDAYPDLSAGRLEACVVADDGAVSWVAVPDPSAASAPTREQVPEATVFPGGEGIWHHERSIYVTTKVDDRVHVIDLEAQRHRILWETDTTLDADDAVLSGVDNVTVDAGTGDLYVAEDGGNMEVVMITPDGVVAPFLRMADPAHEGSEVTGPCFNPARDRLYVSSQRGPSRKTVAEVIAGAEGDQTAAGITYEITGPFRGVDASAAPSPTTTIERAKERAGSGDEGSDDGGSALPFVIGGAAVGAAAVAAAVAWRTRRTGAAAEATGAPDDDQPPATRADR